MALSLLLEQFQAGPEPFDGRRRNLVDADLDLGDALAAVGPQSLGEHLGLTAQGLERLVTVAGRQRVPPRIGGVGFGGQQFAELSLYSRARGSIGLRPFRDKSCIANVYSINPRFVTLLANV